MMPLCLYLMHFDRVIDVLLNNYEIGMSTCEFCERKHAKLIQFFIKKESIPPNYY